MSDHSWKKLIGVRAAALALGVTAVTAGAALAEQVRLLESGSSLLYPLFNLWVGDYARAHPGVQISTQSTGSGTGISQSISGVVQIGASDAYLSDAQMHSAAGMLNIPLAVSAQTVDYNIPGLPRTVHLKLSGPVLAGIYMGTIRTWNAPAIAALNPGVRLPANAIVPVRRSDGSGDTFIFTQYLSASTPAWASRLHYGTTINWPAVQGEIGAQGNPGMVSAAKGVPYSVTYVGISFRNAAAAAGLNEAALVNMSGHAVLASPATVSAAVGATAAKTPPDERISLIFGPGANSYPIINYEYAIVKSGQPSPAVAAEMRTFFNWAIGPAGGNAANYLGPVNFQPLPAPVRALSARQIATIH